jgi:hypothetical protein
VTAIDLEVVRAHLTDWSVETRDDEDGFVVPSRSGDVRVSVEPSNRPPQSRIEASAPAPARSPTGPP